MNSLQATQPIGIFDSGVGGLTVANAIKLLLPNEDIIYFGDTAHLPYGEKSPETIRHYSERISDFLLEHGCKVILIACNTASAVAHECVSRHVDNRAIVLDVIDPVVETIVQLSGHKRVGVIGTKTTIHSAAYPKKIKAARPDLDVQVLATPLLVPMIEEGFIFDDISNAIIRSYLSNPVLADIDALILGCTHYPIIKNQISKYYNFTVHILDSATAVATQLRNTLARRALLNLNEGSTRKFFISDYTDNFKAISRIFFEEDIDLQKLDLWHG
ncbi:MAG TPA: glutamate racemase [Thermodesulfobacteriota bacterium]|nr:glutamate racemase [Deltaproteobacteria bacterium]HNR12146.1 glutamate racemase [Thermodesulfobacteriota bacterium]HNU70573.1 glutamate racemase [Thermodesulfobacteriota bacterium]HOC38595.1 glutamate racemase [Thermodesulfobacteriota bacterium]